MTDACVPPDGAEDGKLEPEDFALYDRMLDCGRRAYLAGLSRDVCPYLKGSKEREFWMEGYDQ